MKIIRSEAGVTVVELVVVAALLIVTLGAIMTLVPTFQRTQLEIDKAFVAQNQGRASEQLLVKIIREGQPLNAVGYEQVYADAQGNFLDIKHDGNIVRFWLDSTNNYVKQFIDTPDGSGLFNYQTAGGGAYTYYATSPPQDSQWDEVRTVGELVVNTPAGTTQGALTDPATDQRLFTFYGKDFDSALDASGAGWMNNIRGVSVYIKLDADEAKAPKAVDIQTNVSIRNLSIK